MSNRFTQYILFAMALSLPGYRLLSIGPGTMNEAASTDRCGGGHIQVKAPMQSPRQCFKFGISVSGTMRMPAASRPWRTAVDTVTAVGPSPWTQIESTWQGMRLPEVE